MNYCKLCLGDNMTYQNRLKALREDHDLSQTKIAELLNVKQITYSQYERGVRELKIEQLKILCQFYGVSSDYVIGLPENLDYPKR